MFIPNIPPIFGNLPKTRQPSILPIPRLCQSCGQTYFLNLSRGEPVIFCPHCGKPQLIKA